MIQYGSQKANFKDSFSYTPWQESKEFLDEEEKRREEKEAREQEEREAASVKEQGDKGLLSGAGEKAGNFFKAAGNTIKDGATGAFDFGKETVKSGKNLIEIKGEQDKEGKYQEGEAEINRKYRKEADEKVWKGFEDASSTDELPKERQEAWNDIQARRKAEMADYSKNNVRGDAEKTNKLFKEQATREEDFKEAGQRFYRGAQYIPGVGIGVETVGGIAASIAGEDSDINKALVELTQSKDWDKLSDEEKKQAITERNLGGALSTLDVVPGLGKVVGTGVKAGVKGGIKAGAKEAAEAYSKTAMSKSLSEVAQLGGKELAKQSAKSAAGGTVLGAGLGVGLNAWMGGDDWQGAATQGAAGGFVGGFLGSPLDLSMGKGAVKGAFDASQTPKGLEDIDATTGKVVDDLDRDARIQQLRKDAEAEHLETRKKEFYDEMTARDMGMSDGTGNPAQGQLALPEGNRARPVKEVEAELIEVQTGEGRYADADPEIRKRRFDELRTEAEAAKRNAETTEFVLNKDIDVNTGRTTADAEADLGRLERGDIPEELQMEHPLVNTAADVVFSKKMPPELTRVADELLKDQGVVNSQLDSLMNPDRYDAEVRMLDENYSKQLESIDNMPPARQRAEADKLEAEYETKLAELDQMRETDTPQVEELTMIQEHLASRESRLTQDVNTLIFDEPEQFRVPNDELVQSKMEDLNRERNINEVTQHSGEVNKPLIGSVEDGIRPSESVNPRVIAAAETLESANSIPRLNGNNKNPTALDMWLGRKRDVLKKFGDAGTAISNILTDAVDSVSIRNQLVALRVRDWSNTAGGKKGMESVARALDGDVDAFSKLNPDQKRVFNQARDMFKEYADNLDLPEQSRIQDYLPHIFDNKPISAVDEALAQLSIGKTLDGKELSVEQVKELQKVTKNLDYETLDFVNRNSLYEVKNGFLKKRQGAEDYSFDLGEIITAYTNSAHNTIILKPAYEKVKIHSESLTPVQNDYLARVVHSIGGRPTDELGEGLNAMLDGMFKTENAYDKGSMKARKLVYDATLGANPGSAVRNLQQGSNTYALLGNRYFAKGAADATMAFKKSNGMFDELLEAGVLQNKYSDLLRQGTAGGKFDDGLWKMFTSVEQFNRGTAYFGAKQRFLDKHVKTMQKKGIEADINNLPDDVLARAKKAGRTMSRRTQFEFSALDTSVKMDGTTMKNLVQLQTYNMEQVRFLRSLIAGNTDSLFVKKPGGGYTMSTTGAMQVARLVGANALFIGAIGGAIGFQPEDAIPFWNEWEKGELPRAPLIKLIAGQHGKGGLLNLGGAIKDGDWESAGEQGSAFAKNAASLLVPGGTQIKKSFEGMDTNAKGFSENDKGNIRFAQDQDTGSKIKSSIFGQYTTEAGQNWIKEGFPTLSEKQTQTVYSQSDDTAKRQYATYYSAIKKTPSRNDAIASAKSAFEDGKENKAKRLMDEYNQAVTEAMQSYYREYDSLPEELLDTLNSKVRIPYKSVIKD